MKNRGEKKMENHNDDHCEEEQANISVGLFFIAVLAALFVIGFLR
jgi:hypothetical protein